MSARTRSWAVAGSMATLVLITSWLLSYPAGMPGAFTAITVGPLLVLTWSGLVLWWLFLLCRFVYRRMVKKPATAKLGLVSVRALVLLLGIAIFSGQSTRLRFELSERQLEQLATRVDASSQSPAPGVRAGLYHVRYSTRSSNGSVVLITHTCGPAADCGVHVCASRRAT